MEPITLYGIHLSPFVRKVRLTMAFKGIKFKHIPVIPVGDDQPPEFAANSPLGKIPLLRVGDTWLPDSSVICAWLEREAPQPPILPTEPLAAARALWYEEYADTHIIAAVGPHLFAEVVLAPLLFKREPIQSDIDMAINVELPQIFDYLENELKDEFLIGTQLSLADIAVGGAFATMQHCDHTCDSKRWPRTATYIDRMLSSDLFAPVIAEEKHMLAAMTE